MSILGKIKDLLGIGGKDTPLPDEIEFVVDNTDPWGSRYKDMRSVWERIRDYVAGNDEEDIWDIGEKESLRIATTALLIHAAVADSVFHRHEYNAMKRMLEQIFHLDELEAEHLILQSKKVYDDSLDINGFIGVISRNYGEKEIRELVKMIWDVILADGETHDGEEAILKRLCGLLGLTEHDMYRLRDAVIFERSQILED